jgi:hypothetical protein
MRSFVASEELAAVRRGHERGLITDEELSQRLGEVERLQSLVTSRSAGRRLDFSAAR